MNENKVMWVRKANSWMALTWEQVKDKMIQKWKWFQTKEQAENYLQKQDE